VVNGETATERIRRLLDDFTRSPQNTRETIRELLNTDPRGFFSAAVPALLEKGAGPGRQYLLALLLARGLIPQCDPDAVTLPQEIELCRAAAAQDPQLERKLASRILNVMRTEPEALTEAERALHILAAISDGTKLAPVLVQLLRHENARVRSKAALMLARASRNPGTVAALLEEPDSGVRAHAVEAMWGVDSVQARNVLWRAAGDSSHRVAGNALLGLLKLGDEEAMGRVRELASGSDPRFRAAAAWAMGASGDGSFLPLLAGMIRDSDPEVRRLVFGAIRSLKSSRGQAEQKAGVPS
jgi:hypothetical protein